MRPTLDETYSWQEICAIVQNRVKKLQHNNDFVRWFMDKEKVGWMFDPMFVARCYRINKDMVNTDGDHFMLIIGPEGKGKSTLATQAAAWIDPNFVDANRCTTAHQYLTRLKSIEKTGCLVIDEGAVALYSRRAMSAEAVTLNRIFMLQRQKNLSVILCIPRYRDIDSMVRERISTLIRITEKGKYCGCVERAIKIINSLKNKKLTEIKLPTGTFWHGTWNKRWPKTLDRADYITQKADHFNELLDEAIEMVSGPKMKPAHIVAKELSLTSKQMRKRIESGTIEAQKIGKNWFVPMEIYRNLLGNGVFRGR